ncbi:MAG: alanine--tRNA ligase [Acidaminococcales bacterium]|jgi:alanyl-tRNA synthetase|nr:alanine--tRNA ligase [Acidaminococcales bacterium]
MVNLTGKELRESFLRFFEGKRHLILPSASLIPENDPTLLLIGAGMAPFKPFFTGKLKPPDVRVVTCQKCIRTGDIENVGRTARHHTFFEMLGNFSFGDYFKKESISWGWEYITEILKIPADKLWITIYTEDDEAFAIWRNDIGVPAERISRMKDNFWEIGPGPCGPCSEIYVDLGEERGCGKPDCRVGCDCDRYLEIWNHVFTQFNKELDGSYSPLAKKNIDTGAGLERIASVLQNKKSNFETDLIFPIIQYAQECSGVKYGSSEKTDISLKVIADHARGVSFMIGDGILPSNEGRGYVLRRVLRRAARHGRLLGIDRLFLAGAVDVVAELFGEHYGNIAEKKDYIKKVIQLEEERFNLTLEQGTELLISELANMREGAGKVLSGETVFKLYDTFGFPLELTEEILAEEGFSIDREAFEEAMNKQRELGRSSRGDKERTLSFPLDFSGCDASLFKVDETAKDSVVALMFETGAGARIEAGTAGQEVIIVLSVSPFHAEGGGQVGDAGSVTGENGAAAVHAVRKLADGTTVQYAQITDGRLAVGDKVTAVSDHARKKATARNHTGTHLLHAALKETLGSHVNQAGSYVGPDRLRFDFSHFSPVGAQELAQVELLVNNEILQGKKLEICEVSRQEARAMDAVALFGEKYGEVVRVVSVPGFSVELCGGTHVANTADIGFFKIVGESAVGAGIRRIEAVTGQEAVAFVQNMDALLSGAAAALKCRPGDIGGRIENIQAELKAAQQQVSKQGEILAKLKSDDIGSAVKDINGIKAAVLEIDTADMDVLRGFGDKMRDKLGASGVAVLFSKRGGGKVDLLAIAGKQAVERGVHAGKLVKELAAAVGGGGGGRPDMAQAGGKRAELVPEAMVKAWDAIKAQLQ